MTDDFPILAAIAANPTHPYQMLEHLQSLGMKATRSTIYRRVEALVQAGLLTAEDQRGPTGHYRRNLALTEQGRAKVGSEAILVLRSEPLGSPIFGLAVAAAGAVERDGAIEVLKQRMAVAARKLTEEERALREFADEPWARASRERRVVHLQADIAWLQGLLSRRAA